jgi:hypothetical protein
MTTVKKASDGDYYLFKRITGGRKEKRFRKNYFGNRMIRIGDIYVPQELWGKKISFKIIIDDSDNTLKERK